MRKAVSFLTASLCLAAVVPALAQAPDMFKDVDASHWAYQATESLRAKGILWGYPDGYFRGKRTLTRYEFAVALDRALSKIMEKEGPAGPQGPQGPQGPAGEAGAAGPQGPAGVTPEELDAFRKLVNEFKEELASMGNNIGAINRRLDALSKDVADIKAQLAKMPKVYGGAFVGVRSNRANGSFVDKDGRLNLAGPGSLVNSPAVVHQFVLGIDASIAGGAALQAELASDNYKNYLGGNVAQVIPGTTGLTSPSVQDTYVKKLTITTPFSGLGRGSSLVLGRYENRISPLTLWRPDTDTYFNNVFVDNGQYTMDGAKFAGRFGSIAADVFGGKMNTVNGVNGGPWNSPLAGITSPAIFMGTSKPFGQVAPGSFTVDQIAGVSLGLNLKPVLGTQGGSIRVHGIALTGTPTEPAITRPTNGGILSADIDLKVADRITLSGDYAKSVTGTGQLDKTGNAFQNNQNTAFMANVGYASGGLSVNAGYRYIDPLFYAPGYWGRIGNWINPTNIQGPTVRAGYSFSPNLGLTVGGDFYSAARGRGDAASGGLGFGDDINRVLVGLKWGLSKNFQTTLDWEGVYWSLDNARFGGTGKVHPTEQYITVGTGLHLTESTVLKLGYQIGNFNGHGALTNGPAGTVGNYNVFTSSVNVKF